MLLGIITYIAISIFIMIIIYNQKNIIEKFLINLIFLMIGTISALAELYIAIHVPKNEEIVYLKKPIIFSVLFISLLLMLMLHNMYYIWKEINSLENTHVKWQKLMYNNRFLFFIASITISISIVIFAYGFLYYIINNLPPDIISDLNGNFMDDGGKKSFVDCIYFSGVTFFTVGYGDMIPKGVFLCILVLLEMVTSYILSIISIPILLSILVGRQENMYIKK
ncbi:MULTISPECIES: potassium channel family protein [Clostridium]|uniref:Ion channel n=1 Tax=Clostridium colicanis DSM 13634 TaxID=1121305 RepID=A0A151AQD2_9CLOT|nr:MULTISPECIES: potassium channel family protein [Clostridium]KYH29846.1 Ion channel [Clostridium colicanis DSM 13634]MBE6042698.1 two pore domain potassium channel family protein [Clostridium thermopalmarium]MBE6079001.1 two pore domain potassium channel family protein [Clostridium lundense]